MYELDCIMSGNLICIVATYFASCQNSEENLLMITDFIV